MRFSVPRSLSPSPVRNQQRRAGSYGLYSSSEDEDDDESSDYESNSDLEAGSSSGSSCSSSSSSVLEYTQERLKSLLRTSKSQLSSPGKRRLDETVASIRAMTRQNGGIEEWGRTTREDALQTARHDFDAKQKHLRGQRHETQERLTRERLARLHTQQADEVQKRLSAMQLQQNEEERKLKATFDVREKELWAAVEFSIKTAEDKEKAKLEAARRVREEAERRKREEEERVKAQKERKQKEEEEKRKEEEDKRRKAEEEKRKEEEEKARDEADKKAKEEALKAQETQRKALGIKTAEQDWAQAREGLVKLKQDTMKVVKADKEMKSYWGKFRRQITPKVGQLTKDDDSINTISTQLLHILVPPLSPPHPPAVYTALLSSLSKAILLQAETEVTAEKHSAIPLAAVTFNLLTALPSFPEILSVKLVQRVGTFFIPCPLPPKDYDGRAWGSDEEKAKVMGHMLSGASSEKANAGGGTGSEVEATADFVGRISGIMRVYFEILKVRPRGQPLEEMFRLPRYWTWFARLMGEKGMLGHAAAASCIYTALDVLGSDAAHIWGHQWVKMLALVYDGVTTGYEPGKLIGGDSPEGKAARARVQMEIERIMGSGK